MSAVEKRREVVRDLLAAGADPRLGRVRGGLVGLAAAHWREVVPTLLDAGVEIDAIAGSQTPLTNAIVAGDDAAAACLATNGASEAAANAYGWSAQECREWLRGDGESLRARAFALDADRLEEIVAAYGADLRDPRGRTLVAHAAAEGNDAAVAFLLANGADPTVRDDEATDALSLAANADHSAIVSALLAAGAEPNRNGACVALSTAVKNDWRDTVAALLEGGANPNSTGPLYPALVLATKHGHSECAQLLIDAGADLELRVGSHESALQWASGHEQPDMVELLLNSGADVNATAADGQTALHAVCNAYSQSSRALRCMSLLLAAGADPRLRAGSSTPYELISEGQERPDKLRQLLFDHATAQPPRDTYELIIWLEHDRSHALEFVRAGGIDELPGFSPVVWALRNDASLAGTLLDAGFDVNGVGRNGEPPLSLVVGDVERVEELLARGADPDPEFGEPLLAAAGAGNIDVVNRLLDAGASPSPVEVGYTPLMAAARAGYTEIVSRLLEAGADPAVCVKTGKNARDWAIEGGHAEIQVMLS